jgi:hypothetical protein
VPVAGGGAFVAGVGVEEQPVHVGVEGCELVFGGAFEFDAAEDVLPLCAGVVADLFEGGSAGDLVVEVALGLVEADQGGRDAHGDFGGVEAQVAGDGAVERLADLAALGGALVEGRVDEHAAGAGGESAADPGVAGDGAVAEVEA